jgi:hypothetical protein
MGSIRTIAFASPAVLGLGLLSIAATSSGCAAVAKALGFAWPSVDLNRVDLVDGPSASQALSWSCFEFVGFCPGLDEPSDAEMDMSFDVVFDMTNENTTFPIPLVEILMGVAVFDDDDLGAMCISFCNPEVDDCTPETDAEDSCDVAGADKVEGASDLVPNATDLASLATGSADDETENGEYRVIPAGDSIEAHIQFDLAGATAMSIGERAVTEAVSSALSSGKFKLEVPYEVEGNVFFEVPEKGRYVTGFGPLEGDWEL